MTHTIRVFMAPMDSLEDAKRAAAADMNSAEDQLVLLWRAYSGARFEHCRVAAVVGDPEAYTDSARPKTLLESARILIPVVGPGDESPWALRKDDDVAVEVRAGQNLEIGVGDLRSPATTSIASNSGNHVAKVTLSSLDASTGAGGTLMEDLTRGAPPANIVGRIAVDVEHVSSEPNSPRAAPFFKFKVVRHRRKTPLDYTEASRSEMQATETMTEAFVVADVALFYDDHPGGPVTPAVWRHLQVCAKEGPLIPEETKYAPFSRINTSPGIHKPILHVGPVFVCFTPGPLYNALVGTTGDGEIEGGGAALIGSDIPPNDVPGDRLHFAHNLGDVRRTRELLRAALSAATDRGQGVEAAIAEVAAVLKVRRVVDAEGEFAQKYKHPDAARGLALWGHLRAIDGSVKLVSNSYDLRTAGGAGNAAEVDDWEDELAQMDREEGADGAAALVDDDRRSHPEKYADSVEEVVDAAGAIGGGERVEGVRVADTRYRYDELTPEMMTSTVLTRPDSETLRVTFQIPAGLFLKEAEGKAHAILDNVASKVQEAAVYKRSMTHPDGKIVSYPNFKERRITGPGTAPKNVSMKISFFPGGKHRGDAARIAALYHILFLKDAGDVPIQVFVAYGGVPPTAGAIKAIKYQYGKDPRVTPLRDEKYKEAVAASLEARRAERAAYTSKTGIVLSKESVGVIANLERSTAAAAAFADVGDPATLTSLDDIEVAYTQIIQKFRDNPDTRDERYKALRMRKIQILQGLAREKYREYLSFRTARKDQVSHERFGRANAEYQGLAKQIISTARSAGLDRATIVAMFADYHNGLYMDMITRLVDSAGRTRTNVVRVSAPARGAVGGARSVVIGEIVSFHRPPRDLDQDTLDEISNAQKAMHYASLVERKNLKEDVSVADYLFALSYEKTITGKRVFTEERDQRKRTETGLIAAKKDVLGALLYSEALAKDKSGAGMAALTIAGFLQRLTNDARSDFLLRLRHWVSTPTFDPVELPDKDTWESSDPDAFNAWAHQAGVETSYPSIGVGAARIGERPIERRAVLEVLHAYISDHVARTRMTMEETPEGGFVGDRSCSAIHRIFLPAQADRSRFELFRAGRTYGSDYPEFVNLCGDILAAAARESVLGVRDPAGTESPDYFGLLGRLGGVRLQNKQEAAIRKYVGDATSLIEKNRAATAKARAALDDEARAIAAAQLASNARAQEIKGVLAARDDLVSRQERAVISGTVAPGAMAEMNDEMAKLEESVRDLRASKAKNDSDWSSRRAYVERLQTSLEVLLEEGRALSTSHPLVDYERSRGYLETLRAFVAKNRSLDGAHAAITIKNSLGHVLDEIVYLSLHRAGKYVAPAITPPAPESDGPTSDMGPSSAGGGEPRYHQGESATSPDGTTYTEATPARVPPLHHPAFRRDHRELYVGTFVAV